MRIVEIKANNIKRVKAILLKPKQHVNLIEGKNAHGKTSALDVILMGLGGKKYIPSQPVNNEAEKGDIHLDLGGIKVTRTFSKTGKTYLKVTNKDGFQPEKPQNFLDGLIGELSFDPMAFTTMDPKKRMKVLKEIACIDFTKIDKEILEAEDKRRLVKKEGVALKAKLPVEGACHNVYDVRPLEEIKKDIAIQAQVKQEYDAHCSEVRSTEHEIKTVKDRIAETYNKINDLQKEVKESEALFENLKVKYVALTEKKIAEPKDFGDLLDEQGKALENEETRKTILAEEELKKEYSLLRAEYSNLDHSVSALREEKVAMVQNAKYPIDGMGFVSDDIAFNGIPFTQLSTSEKIKLSLAMASKLNPKLRIVRIMDGSLLDNAAMKEVADYAEKEDLQVFIERVCDEPSGRDNAFYIEDGGILEV